MTSKAPASSENEATDVTLIGQSIQISDAPDDTSVLDMSWNNIGRTRSHLPASAEVSSPSPDISIPQSIRRPSIHNENFEDAELSKLTEAAAISIHGSAAAVSGGAPLRKSTLVANDSSLEPKWFAERGLMSRRSFEKYKKELRAESRRRSTMVNEHGRPQYLSKSMRKNEEFDPSELDLPRPTASDLGHDMLGSEKKQKAVLKKNVHKSRSLDNGLDYLVRTFISALEEDSPKGDKEEKMHALKTKLSDSLNRGRSDADGSLNKNEVEALTRIMVKLIKEPPKTEQDLKTEGKKETEEKKEVLVRMDSLHDDASLELNDLFSDKPILTSASTETMKRTSKKKAGQETKPPSKEVPNFVKGFNYAPKRMSSTGSAISDTSSLAVTPPTSMNADRKRLDMIHTMKQPLPMAELLPPPTCPDYNESLSSIQPLANYQRNGSSLTEIVYDELRQELMQEEHAATTSIMKRKSFSDGRPRSPSRRASFTDNGPERRLSFKDSSAIPLRRSSASLEMDYDCLEGPAPKLSCGDILAEGMEYLSMTMLVNVYGKLREMSILGHASVKLIDVDVNSHQRISRLREMKRRGLIAELEKEEAKGYLDTTKTAEFVVRTVLDEYDMFEASSELSPLDMVSKASLQYDASLLAEFKTWVEESRVKQLDSVTEDIIKKLRERSAKHEAMMADRASYSSLSSLENVHSKTVAERRFSLENKDVSFQSSTWSRKERTLIEDHFQVDKRRTSQEELSSLIDKTIQESSSDYFEEGSVMKNLLVAGVEVVWFSDRHPNDIIYCICVNRTTKTVTVLFRARESIFNLIVNSKMTEYRNPISHEDYDGNSEFIKLRSDTVDEMLRERRDTKLTTVEEIMTRVEKIGHELDATGHYHVSVAGHGTKAGGMATVLGYFLAANPNFKAASAVRVFSFASSRVGCKDFQNSFEHLEKSGRILHGRFTTSYDLSFLPSFALDENWRFNGWYKDVGMHVRLHKSDYAGRQRTKKSLDVTYSTNSKQDGAIVQCLNLGVSILSSFIALFRGGWGKNSRISVFQSRMHFAREYRLALAGADYRYDMKRKHLKSLNDYYLMKCRCVENYSVFKVQRDGNAWILVFALVSFLISFEMALLFRFVSKW